MFEEFKEFTRKNVSQQLFLARFHDYHAREHLSQTESALLLS
jgi:hypothetical protein